MIRLAHLGTELAVDDDGRVRVEGSDLHLDASTMHRLRMAIEPDRLRGLGATVGVGNETSTLTACGASISIRHRGNAASIARSVAGVLDTLLGLADVVRGRCPLDSWAACLPLPIETAALVVRFHTFEPRVHDATNRDRFTSIFTDGRCLLFDDASFDARGRFTSTKKAPRDSVVRIATLVAQLGFPRSVDGTFEHDEDRNIAMVLQRPDPKTGELVTSRWSWSFWAGAERACRENIEKAYAPGEHALVHALYELLVPLR